MPVAAHSAFRHHSEVGNQFDPATPYAGAQTVAATLPGARLLTLHAWGHTSGFLSSWPDEAIARYLGD